MSFFNDIYKRLFASDEQTDRSTVSVNSIIKRSPKFMAGFEEWKVSDQATQWLEEIWQSFYWQKKGVDKQPVLLILESNLSNGFALSYKEVYGKKAFKYLFDLLAEQVRELGYRLVLSRRTIEEKGSEVESKEMHYLKPKVSFVEPIEQEFGNIQIEYIEENDQPLRIKFRANTYPDRKYKKAKSFDELAEIVLSKNN